MISPFKFEVALDTQSSSFCLVLNRDITTVSFQDGEFNKHKSFFLLIFPRHRRFPRGGRERVSEDLGRDLSRVDSSLRSWLGPRRYPVPSQATDLSKVDRWLKNEPPRFGKAEFLHGPRELLVEVGRG